MEEFKVSNYPFSDSPEDKEASKYFMSKVNTSIAFSTHFPNGPQGWLPDSKMNALHTYAYENLADFAESSYKEGTPYLKDFNGKGPLTIAFEKKSFEAIEFIME